jgi:hypothetical protein
LIIEIVPPAGVSPVKPLTPALIVVAVGAS